MTKAQGVAPPIDLAIYNDRTSPALPGWDNLRPEDDCLWSLTMCKKYITMSHLLRHWPNVETRETWNERWELPLEKCRHEVIADRYIEVYDALHEKKWDELPRTPTMTYSNTAMVYAEVILKKRVDWSTATARNKRTLLRMTDIPSTIPALQHAQDPEGTDRGLSPTRGSSNDATHILNDILDAEMAPPTRCVPPPQPPSNSAGESCIHTDEEFGRMRRLLDDSYTENDVLRNRIQALEQAQVASDESTEMAKISELLQVSQRNLNEAVDRLNALYSSVRKGKKPA